MRRHMAIVAFMVVIIFTGILFAGLEGVSAKDYPYRVTKVHDGDTFTATDGNLFFRVRIAGMDAPEKGQPYGKVATHRLSEMILDKDVEITPVGNGIDSYGRVLGSVQIGGENVALSLIRQGLALYYRPTCQDYPADKKKYNYDPTAYVVSENAARSEKLNIWREAEFVYPCKYRKRK